LPALFLFKCFSRQTRFCGKNPWVVEIISVLSQGIDNCHLYFQPQILHVLFEHASGYALFRVKEFEEIGLLLPEVEESVGDLSRFNAVVKLAAFSPFKSGTNALDNMNSISEGM
jgi:hypothetical protein